MKEFLSAIEDLPFSKDMDEFSTEECVICLEKFEDNEMIKRIPTCRHFFHPTCIEAWYKGKVMEDV